MKFVGSGSQREAGDALASPAVFRGRVERNNFEFRYCVLREGEIAKIPGPFGWAANDRPIELKLIAGTLASIHRGVQHARRTAVRHSAARHAGSQGHEVPGIPLFSHSNKRQFEDLLSRNDSPAVRGVFLNLNYLGRDLDGLRGLS